MNHEERLYALRLIREEGYGRLERAEWAQSVETRNRSRAQMGLPPIGSH